MKRKEIVSWDEKIEYLHSTVLGLEDIIFELLDTIPEVGDKLNKLYDAAIEYNKGEE